MKELRLLNVILSPHISEKASFAMQKNEYVFHVASSASKPDVKQAVEQLFNTSVKEVRIVNVRAKKKMFRGKQGQHKAWKKAYVTLATGQKIDFVGAQ